ncbi:SAM-dependent methyltransferase [Humibacillus xanthopallidus]|uniref:SAM-dependent methyltransferase n=1 Tax=Humibacillus xanthopallidus TaxID=412689 RepID=UPI0021AB2988|nr:SAM-dependent methyltransferase [Humibacillus xanthopallidus]
MDALPWREAWHDALYAAGRGFYVTRGGPAEHFTTATHGVTGAVLAESLLRLWLREHEQAPAVVVDVGAGRGELATHLLTALTSLEEARPHHPDECPLPDTPDRGELGTRPHADDPPDECPLPDTPDRGELGTRLEGEAGRGLPATRVVAVDVVARPAGLDERIDWLRSPGGAALPAELTGLHDALVIAHEWLDVVPCTVAEVDPDGETRVVLVDPVTGAESLGAPLDPADRHWADRHWPTTTPGERLEVGRTRDEAWADLVSRVGTGLLVAVDYAHVARERPGAGTLTAYRRGVRTEPVPDGTMDLTAHVAIDTLDADDVGRQRDVLRDLGVRGRTPPHALAATDPLGYLRALERAAAEAELIRPGGFGDFWWAVKRAPGGDVA